MMLVIPQTQLLTFHAGKSTGDEDNSHDDEEDTENDKPPSKKGYVCLYCCGLANLILAI